MVLHTASWLMIFHITVCNITPIALYVIFEPDLVGSNHLAALRWGAAVHNKKLSKSWLHHRVLLGTLLFSVGQRHSKGTRLWRTIHRRAFEVHQLLQEEVPRLCYNCCPVGAKKTKSKSRTATGFLNSCVSSVGNSWIRYRQFSNKQLCRNSRQGGQKEPSCHNKHWRFCQCCSSDRSKTTLHSPPDFPGFLAFV